MRSRIARCVHVSARYMSVYYAFSELFAGRGAERDDKGVCVKEFASVSHEQTAQTGQR